jgi:iron(III) transport system permease protein
LVAGVVSAASAIAVPLAWLVARTDLRARRFWAVMGALPLVLPSYVAAFSLVAVLGPRGSVQSWLEPFGVERLPDIAHGYSGALLALSLFTFPYIYLLLVTSLRGIDPALEESARSLGSGRRATFFRVVLPQLRPALYGGALLVALYTVSDFGAVSITRYDTLTLGVFNAYAGLFDRGVAAVYSTVLAFAALGLVAGQTVLQRRVRPSRGRPARPPVPVALGRLQLPCQILLGILATLTVVAPVGVILAWGVHALAQGSVGIPDALISTGRSLLAATLTALLTVALSFPVAVWAVRGHRRVARINERLCYSGYALPGLVIALSLVFMATRSLPWAYQTLSLLVVAYVIRFLPEAVSATHAALSEVAPSLEEAGRSLGRGWFSVTRAVTLPLIRPGLLAGGGLVFLTTMKELPATLILRPLGFETLATEVWGAASEGVYSEAAVPAALLVTLSAVPVYLLIIRPVLANRT